MVRLVIHTQYSCFALIDDDRYAACFTPTHEPCVDPFQSLAQINVRQRHSVFFSLLPLGPTGLSHPKSQHGLKETRQRDEHALLQHMKERDMIKAEHPEWDKGIDQQENKRMGGTPLLVKK